MKGKGTLANNTINLYLTKLKSLIIWAKDNNLCNISEVDLKKMVIKFEEVDIITLTEDEFNAFKDFDIDSLDLTDLQKGKWKYAQSRCIIEGLCGLRVSDSGRINYSIENVNGQKFLRMVLSKTRNSSRATPLIPVTEELQRHLDFVAGSSYSDMNPVSINKYAKKIAEKAGLTREITFVLGKRGYGEGEKMKLHDLISTHPFRAFCATNLHKYGWNIKEIMTLIGWKKVETAMKYITTDADTLAERSRAMVEKQEERKLKFSKTA